MIIFLPSLSHYRLANSYKNVSLIVACFSIMRTNKIEKAKKRANY